MKFPTVTSGTLINKAILLSMSFGLAVLTVPNACTKNGQKNEGLAGNWEWLRTDGGIAGHIHDTPASTGRTVELRLTADNRYFIYTNGSLSGQGTYVLETRNCIHDHSDKPFINFSADNQQDLMVEKLEGNNLTLSDEAFDGLTSQYQRK